MATREGYSPSGRIPQRARGRERREAVIDAACAILTDAGEEALTLHAAALRANSSIGSMYHFFSDRDQLLRAVADRHRDALTRLAAPSRRLTLDAWRNMDAAQVIDVLFREPIDYFVAHPDALIVHHLQDTGPARSFQSLLLRIMRARLGAAEGERVAATLYAVSTGTLAYLRGMRETLLPHDSIDIGGALIAYLERIERGTRSEDAG
ncbi:MAG: TetR/AcrR family transcriptional regulator [Sphingomonadaceae bacterium]|nr:TetR/AcrR family transcriptional regulator [Sphingomonadaceae bacterium]